MLPGSFMCFLDDVLCYARAFGYKCALRAIQKKRKLSIADQIVSVFPGKMRKIHNLAGSRAGTPERSPLLHKFLHDEFA